MYDYDDIDAGFSTSEEISDLTMSEITEDNNVFVSFVRNEARHLHKNYFYVQEYQYAAFQYFYHRGYYLLTVHSPEFISFIEKYDLEGCVTVINGSYCSFPFDLQEIIRAFARDAGSRVVHEIVSVDPKQSAL